MDNIRTRIAAVENQLTKSEKIIVANLLENMPDFSIATITNVADRCGVSTSAMLRFVQKLGFSGYSEFKYEMVKEAHSGSINDNVALSTDIILGRYHGAIDAIRSCVSEEQLVHFAKDIVNSKHIFIYGLNRSGLTAQHFFYRLMQLEIVSLPITDAVLMKDLPFHTSDEDLHIFITVNCGTSTCDFALKNIAAVSDKTTLLTMNKKASWLNIVDNPIVLPAVERSSFYIDEQSMFHIFLELAIPYIIKEVERKNKVK